MPHLSSSLSSLSIKRHQSLSLLIPSLSEVSFLSYSRDFHSLRSLVAVLDSAVSPLHRDSLWIHSSHFYTSLILIS